MKKAGILLILLLILPLIYLSVVVKAGDDLYFDLPSFGGGMVHSNPQMTDCIDLPVPKNDVKIIWHKNNLSGEKAGAKGNGISANGEIAACSFSGKKDNLVIYDYDGNRIWKSGDLLNFKSLFSTPIIDINNRVIACDDHLLVMIDPFDVDSDEKIIEWKTELSYGGLPFSPVIVGNDTIVVATNNGPVYVYDINGSLIAYKYLGLNEKTSFKSFSFKNLGFFSTINTPCVNGSRIYVSTHYKTLIGLPSFLHHARLYAIDIDRDNPDIDKRLTEAWFYEFGGPSQASPLFYNNTIYFDGYRPEPSIKRNVHLFAVKDMGDFGEEKWKVRYPKPTYASFTLDPRGGFWYIDPFGEKVNRFSMDDGKIIEIISVDDLLNEDGKHLPSSVMTIFGNESNPVLILSATCLRPFRASSYIVAIDLENNNSLLWKIKLYQGPLWKINLGFGEYIVLMKYKEPRVLFGSFSDGVYALGSEK